MNEDDPIEAVWEWALVACALFAGSVIAGLAYGVLVGGHLPFIHG